MVNDNANLLEAPEDERGQDLGEAIAGVFEMLPPELGDRHLPRMFDALRGALPAFVRSYLVTQNADAAARQAWPWPTDARGECLDEEKRQQSLELGQKALLNFGVRQVEKAYLERAACPGCGTRRVHEEGMGRIFWHECEPCMLVERAAAFDVWRARSKAAWDAKAHKLIGKTHWPARVELMPQVARLLEGRTHIRWAYLYGPAGTGKTQQSAELVRAFLKLRLMRYVVGDMERFLREPPPFPSVHFVQEARLLASLKPGGGGCIEDYTTPELLIVDDLGESKPSDWAYEQMKLILDERYRNKALTVFTSNRSPRELRAPGALYDERLTQRMFELCGGKQAQRDEELAVLELTTCHRMGDDEGGVW